MYDDRQFYQCLNAALSLCIAIAAVTIIYLFVTTVFAGKVFLLASIAMCGLFCLWLKWGDELTAKIGFEFAEE